MNKKRVCHISTVHRGVEIRIIRKEVASMAEAGYDAHAVIAATPEEVAEAARLGVTIHPLKERKVRIERMTLKMYEAWNTARKLKAEIYHFHDPELIPLGVFMKLCGHRIVMDVHEDLANQTLNKHWIPLPIRKVVGKIARGFERFGARFFDGVVTASPTQATFFQDVAARDASTRCTTIRCSKNWASTPARTTPRRRARPPTCSTPVAFPASVASSRTYRPPKRPTSS